MSDRSANLGKYLHPKSKAKVRSAALRHEQSGEKKAQEKAKEAKLKAYKNPATGGVRG